MAAPVRPPASADPRRRAGQAQGCLRSLAAAALAGDEAALGAAAGAICADAELAGAVILAAAYALAEAARRLPPAAGPR